MADSFGSTLFKQTFEKVFEKDVQGQLKMRFNATMEVGQWYFLFSHCILLCFRSRQGMGLKSKASSAAVLVER